MTLSEKDGHVLINIIQEISGAFELALEAKSKDEQKRRATQAHDAVRKAADFIKSHTRKHEA